ncbi:MAG TPA: DUF2149 domain-containing protein [Solirubrobacterales bacterium]|nr:DUF2149 domain-containing protein [Solirubrobacterales bacterium]
MKRTGLGRHGLLEENAGDPLDGLVNLFDVGMILAVAFLIAGLGLTLNVNSGDLQKRVPTGQGGRVIPSPAASPSASGRGEQVGRVYRLPDGRLVYVKGEESGGR